jgi:hypothetical protein
MSMEDRNVAGPGGKAGKALRWFSLEKAEARSLWECCAPCVGTPEYLNLKTGEKWAAGTMPEAGRVWKFRAVTIPSRLPDQSARAG